MWIFRSTIILIYKKNTIQIDSFRSDRILGKTGMNNSQITNLPLFTDLNVVFNIAYNTIRLKYQ